MIESYSTAKLSIEVESYMSFGDVNKDLSRISFRWKNVPEPFIPTTNQLFEALDPSAWKTYGVELIAPRTNPFDKGKALLYAKELDSIATEWHDFIMANTEPFYTYPYPENPKGDYIGQRRIELDGRAKAARIWQKEWRIIVTPFVNLLAGDGYTFSHKFFDQQLFTM